MDSQFFIRQKVNNYISQVQSWERSVRSQRSLRHAVIAANHQPATGGFGGILNAHPSVRSSLTQAKRAIERSLDEKMSAVIEEDQKAVLPLFRGHWPELYRKYARSLGIRG